MRPDTAVNRALHEPQHDSGPKGPGCSGCAYVGWGPGMAARCRHPERWCWPGPAVWPVIGAASPQAQWKVGCDRKHPWGERPPKPRPVKLSDHSRHVADARGNDAPSREAQDPTGLQPESRYPVLPDVPTRGHAGPPRAVGATDLSLWAGALHGAGPRDVRPVAPGEEAV